MYVARKYHNIVIFHLIWQSSVGHDNAPGIVHWVRGVPFMKLHRILLPKPTWEQMRCSTLINCTASLCVSLASYKMWLAFDTKTFLSHCTDIGFTCMWRWWRRRRQTFVRTQLQTIVRHTLLYTRIMPIWSRKQMGTVPCRSSGANKGGGAGQGLRTKELFAAEGSEHYWGGRSRISFVRATYFVRLL